MFCDNCGNQIADNAQFCGSYGTAREAFQTPINFSVPNDPDRGVKFIGYDEKVPQRGSFHLRNWILGILFALLIIGLGICSELSGQRMNSQATSPAIASAVNNK